MITRSLLTLSLLALPLGAQQAHDQDHGTARPGAYQCRTRPAAGTPGYAGSGGGMAGSGWDGLGVSPVTLTWHVEGSTPDMPGDQQRQDWIDALQAWADVVQITFVEVPVPNLSASLDMTFASGDHGHLEGAEVGDGDCPFDGATGVVAHAGFPPGVNATCPGVVSETFAGNVHFDEAELWEPDSGSDNSAMSLKLIAVHEIGHALGLTHSAAPDVMRPSFGAGESFSGLSSGDIGFIQNGYAPGQGQVLTLEQLGIWVNLAWSGPEQGTAGMPFDSVGEAADGVPPGSTEVPLVLLPGTYTEGAQVFDQAMHLTALGGTAVIR